MSRWSTRLDAATEDLDARETRVREREADIEIREKLYDPLYLARETCTLCDELWHLIERTAEVRARIANARVALTLWSSGVDTIAISKIRATRPEATPFVDPKNMNDDERRAWHRRYILALGRDPNTWANRYDIGICAREMGWDLPPEYVAEGYVSDPDEPADPDLASRSAALAKREKSIVRRERWVRGREGYQRTACDELERVHAHLASGAELERLREVIRVDAWVPSGW